MKIKIAVDDDCVDEIVVKSLKRSASNVKALRYIVEDDKDYAKRYLAAVKIVLAHYGC